MLGSITPLGERGRGSRWGITMAAFLSGSTAGGALLGAFLGLAGGAVPVLPHTAAPRLWILAGLVGGGVLYDLRPDRSSLPTLHRQVNEDWLHRYRGWVYGIGFGFQLGLGMATVVTVSAVYTFMAAAFLTGSAAAGASIGAIFGAIRASTAFSVAGVRRPDQLAAVDARLRAWDGPSRRLTVGVELALALACLTAALV
jgi:hypothetical protein